MRKFIFLILFIFLNLHTQKAFSQNEIDTINDILIDAKDSYISEIMIGSIGRGIVIANSYVNVVYDKKIYCAPAKLAITSAQYVKILNDYIKINKEDGERKIVDLSFVLLKSLIYTFPCDQ